MEREDSLPHSQEPPTRPYSEPVQSSPCPPSRFLKIRFNIILPSTPNITIKHNKILIISAIYSECFGPYGPSSNTKIQNLIHK